MQCEFCGLDKPGVKTVVDPFADDVNNEEVMVDICDDCYGDRVDEI